MIIGSNLLQILGLEQTKPYWVKQKILMKATSHALREKNYSLPFPRMIPLLKIAKCITIINLIKTLEGFGDFSEL